MSIVTSSMNSAPNSLFQEQLGVGLALSGGELGPISCPNLLFLPQTPFGASQQSYHHHLSVGSGNPRSPLLLSIFGFSFTQMCYLLAPIVALPLPGGEGLGSPLPLHAPINSTGDFPGDLGDGEKGGGEASRLQECRDGAKVAAECHLLSLADCALADHFPFTSPLRAAGVWQMNQLLRL